MIKSTIKKIINKPLGDRFIIGIDVSLTSTGYCIMSLDDTFFDIDTIKTKADNSVWGDMKRMHYISDTIIKTCSTFHIEDVFIEAPAFSAYDNEGRLAQLRGILLHQFYIHRSLHPYPNYVAPMKLKKFITGKGNSKKTLMGDAVRRHYAKQLLDATFNNDDEIDAFALAKFGQSLIRTLLKVEDINNLPKYQQEALEGVTINVSTN